MTQPQMRAKTYSTQQWAVAPPPSLVLTPTEILSALKQTKNILR